MTIEKQIVKLHIYWLSESEKETGVIASKSEILQTIEAGREDYEEKLDDEKKSKWNEKDTQRIIKYLYKLRKSYIKKKK